ncbi:hypothetical protein Tco_0782483, partial [Tanacetum coccineum]
MNNKESPSPLTKWIEEFQLSDGLRVSARVRYYDRKGDPNDFIHAFEGTTKMEKWVMPVSCHIYDRLMTKYTPGYKQKKRLPKADLSSSWTTTQEKIRKNEGHRKGQEGRTEKDEIIKNGNCRVRDDTFYNALHSLIPVREEKIIINPKYPEKTETIGRKLPIKAKQRLNKLLKDNADMFAWQYTDMTGIPRTLNIRGEIFATEYKLNEDKKITLIQQNKRRIAPNRIAATSKEVEELKKARILRETRYQTWAPNTVMIDWKVDSLSDFKLKCFLDAYKGYHQIQMAKEVEHKIAFHAPQEVYCYLKMPFGLKNAGDTYQRYDSRHTRNLQKVREDIHETQPEEVLFRDGRRPIPGARGVKA